MTLKQDEIVCSCILPTLFSTWGRNVEGGSLESLSCLWALHTFLARLPNAFQMRFIHAISLSWKIS